MKKTDVEGVFQKNGRLFTENPENCKGVKVYGENIRVYKNREFRSWNPYRSKLAAAILKGMKPLFTRTSEILYLGAATGTTVSHLSDIVTDGIVYAVENSPVAMKNLVELAKVRPNIIPLLADANHPERYSSVVPQVDLVYQDISQRNQSDIFIRNLHCYLKPTGQGFIMVKARSIDISRSPKQVFRQVQSELEKENIQIVQTQQLDPYEKDHIAIITSIYK